MTSPCETEGRGALQRFRNLGAIWKDPTCALQGPGALRGGISLDWFKGKSTGNFGKMYGNYGFTHWFTGNYGKKCKMLDFLQETIHTSWEKRGQNTKNISGCDFPWETNPMIHELSLHFWDISIINLWWDIFQNHQRASSQSCGCSFFGKSVISILMANAANAQNLKCSKLAGVDGHPLGPRLVPSARKPRTGLLLRKARVRDLPWRGGRLGRNCLHDNNDDSNYQIILIYTNNTN